MSVDLAVSLAEERRKRQKSASAELPSIPAISVAVFGDDTTGDSAAAKAEVAHLRRDRETAQENLRKIQQSLERARREESAQAAQVAKVQEDSDRRIHDILERARDARDGNISLRVVSLADGHEMNFKCKETTPLQKLMLAYCNREGVSMGSVRFLFDGNRINDTQTPGGLGMEAGDVIDVMQPQV